MKSVFNILLILSLPSFSLAQKTQVNIENLPVEICTLGVDNYEAKEFVKYNQVRIVDGRFDTSKIGYWKINSGPLFKQVRLHNSTDQITSALHKSYAASFSKSPYTFFIVIKKLWISQADTSANGVTTPFYSSWKQHILVNLKFECYLNFEDSYYPISRVDSLWKFNLQSIQEVVSKNLTHAITEMIKEPMLSDPRVILQTKKKLTLDQIMSNLQREKNWPVLHDSKPRRGVFTTFSDFLHNKPTQDYVNVDNLKYGDVLYLRDKSGAEYPSNKFWGYCDGVDYYITAGKNFFKLFRGQNSFAFHGTLGIQKGIFKSALGFNNVNLNLQKNTIDMHFFIYQIDMESGGIL